MGWVSTEAQKWTESGCQWRLCTLMSELTVHMLKCIVSGDVCCPLILKSSFTSFIQQVSLVGVQRFCKCKHFLLFQELNQ